MAVELADGFDTYSYGQVSRYYLGGTLFSAMVPGFGGLGQAVNLKVPLGTVIDSSISFPLTARQEYILGFDFEASASSSIQWFRLRNSAGTAILTLTNTGTAATLNINGTDYANVLTGTWQNFVIRVVADASAGIITVRVDGVTIYAGTGLNTGSLPIKSCLLRADLNTGINIYVDNFWVFNTLGSHSHAMPNGRIRVAALYPNSDGSFRGFTPDSGTDHYSRVNEAQPDDDTSYVSSDVPATDSYGIESLPSSGIDQVHAVQVRAVHRKDDVNPKVLHLMARSGLVTTESTDIQPPTAYTAAALLLTDDPNTGQQWQPTDVDAMEIGVKEIN